MAPDETAADDSYSGPEEKTLTLKKPLKLHPTDENPISEITLTEPTAGQLSQFMKAQAKPGADDVEAGCVLIAANVKVTRAAFSKEHAMQMSSREFEEALDFLTGFTKAARKIGSS